VLANHPAVLIDPEPSVLVDSLGTSTVNLRIYFWLNGREHSWLKVRSSVMRLVKIGFQKHGISMPDEAREIVFPRGIPIHMVNGKPAPRDAGPTEPLTAPAPREEFDAASTDAEGGLASEAEVIKEQARHVRPLNNEENLLKETPGTAATRENAKGHAGNGVPSRT